MEAAGAVKELVMLHEHRQDRERKQQFMAAFAAVRAKVKTVNATKAIPDKQGAVKWYYAPLEDIQDEVEPVLEEHGLTLRFDSRREGNICTGICWLSHVAGHEEKSECAVNAANAEGGDLGALKKAKRGALIAILGIKTRHDDDARMLGDYVSPDQAAELKRRLLAVGRDERKFLAFAGADEWKHIRQGRLHQLHEFLRQAERAKAGETGKPTENAGGAVGKVPEARTSAASAAPPAAGNTSDPSEPPPEEQSQIIAEERAEFEAEKFASNAVDAGGKTLHAAFSAIPASILQEAVSANKFPPFKDRTKEQNKSLLKMCKIKMILKKD